MNQSLTVSPKLNTRYPVLMVHGLGVRDDLPLLHYWGRLPRHLGGLGVSIHLSCHDAWASVENNAHHLKKRIEEILALESAEKINLIAHSKGGIECRRVIHLFGGSPPIASLTTIATPHRGAALADWLLKFKAIHHDRVHQVLSNLGRLIGDHSPDSLMALNQLTSEYMREFNRLHPDLPAVHYRSVASVLQKPVLDPLFLVSHRILMELEGENDGVVGTEQCRWGEHFSLWGGKRGLSHIDVSDMSGFNRRRFDVRRSYVELIESLREMGC